MSYYRTVLAIAGSDSCGGSGIQADLKTFSALGCYGSSVITAVTAQNTQGVKSVHPLPDIMVEEQIDSVMTDIGADAVKIGMLYSPSIVRTVRDGIKVHKPRHIVVDPVMVSSTSFRLIENDAIDALKSDLFYLATIITPNILEAEMILGSKIEGLDAMKDAARELLAYGSEAVLLTGGHMEGDTIFDVFAAGESVPQVYETQRISSNNTYGAGCTLSSAIAAHLAIGYNILEAVEKSKNYVSKAIYYGMDYTIGKESGPINHFFDPRVLR